MTQSVCIIFINMIIHPIHDCTCSLVVKCYLGHGFYLAKHIFYLAKHSLWQVSRESGPSLPSFRQKL